MNWGGFGGGFTQGFNNGIQMGKTINDLVKEDKLQKVREQGLAEAKAASEAAAVNSVRENGISQKIGQAPVTGEAPQTGQPAPDNAVAQTAAIPQPTTQVMTPQDSQPAITTPAAAPTPTTAAIPAPDMVQPPPAAATPQAAQPAPSVQAPATTPAAAGMPQAPKPWMVGDKGFDTREEALAHAKKTAPSTTDFFLKNAVPKISEAYLAQGDVAKAEAWDKYAKDKESQKNMETWSKAFRAAQSGDMDAAAEHVFTLYKAYDDGVTPLSKETVKDKDGNVTGFNVRLKNDETGEVRSQFIDQRQLTEMGLSALSPPAMFEQQFKRQQAADQLRAKASIDAANDKRTLDRELAVTGAKAKATAAENEKKFGRDKEMQGIKGDQKIEQITIEEQIKSANVGAGEKRKIAAKVDALKAAGYTEDQLNGMMPALVGAGDYKKRTSPEEARRLLLTERVKDPLFPKDPAAQKQIIDNDMQTIYGEAPATKATTVPNPVLPAAPTPPTGGPSAAPAGQSPQKRTGVPVFDSKTGTIVYR